MAKRSKKAILKELYTHPEKYFRLIRVRNMDDCMLFFWKREELITPELLLIDRDNYNWVDYTSLEITQGLMYEGEGRLIEYVLKYDSFASARIKAFGVTCDCIVHWYIDSRTGKANIRPLFLVWNSELSRHSNLKELYKPAKNLDR